MRAGDQRVRPERGCINACTRARHEAVVDEHVLFDLERRIVPLEVAGTVILDAVPQSQVLRTRRGSDRIGLHEAKGVERADSEAGAGKLRLTANRRRSSRVTPYGNSFESAGE